MIEVKRERIWTRLFNSHKSECFSRFSRPNWLFQFPKWQMSNVRMARFDDDGKRSPLPRVLTGIWSWTAGWPRFLRFIVFGREYVCRANHSDSQRTTVDIRANPYIQRLPEENATTHTKTYFFVLFTSTLHSFRIRFLR